MLHNLQGEWLNGYTLKRELLAPGSELRRELSGLQSCWGAAASALLFKVVLAHNVQASQMDLAVSSRLLVSSLFLLKDI